jgi:hypothetical protein
MSPHALSHDISLMRCYCISCSAVVVIEEFVDEDGFRYKRRRRQTVEEARARPAFAHARPCRFFARRHADALAHAQAPPPPPPPSPPPPLPAGARPLRVRPLARAHTACVRSTLTRSPPLDSAPVYPAGRPLVAVHDTVPLTWHAEERLKAVCEAIGTAETASAASVFHSAATALAAAGAPAAAAAAVRVPAMIADALAEWQLQVEAAAVSGALRFAATSAGGANAAPAASDAAAAARLAAQRDAWAAEEAAWLALAADADADAAAAAEAAAQLTLPAPAAAAAAAAVASIAAHSAEGTLSSCVADAARRLELQVDAVSALVTGADVLAARADVACTALAGALADAELGAFKAAGSPRQLLLQLAGGR